MTQLPIIDISPFVKSLSHDAGDLSNDATSQILHDEKMAVGKLIDKAVSFSVS